MCGRPGSGSPWRASAEPVRGRFQGGITVRHSAPTARETVGWRAKTSDNRSPLTVASHSPERSLFDPEDSLAGPRNSALWHEVMNQIRVVDGSCVGAHLKAVGVQITRAVR